MPDLAPSRRGQDLHKALADDTRFRLYRYLGRAGRPVSVREVAQRLSLHPNTLRPHLRRLEEAGLVTRDVRRGAAVGRPQVLYAVAEPTSEDARDYRLLAEMLAGMVRGRRSLERAHELAREWGRYLIGRGSPKPGVRAPAGRNLAMLQEAMSAAGFDPRFRRIGDRVQIGLRMCPFRDLTEDHRELACTLHQGLLEGMLAGLDPPLEMSGFTPFAERTVCRLVAEGVTRRGGGGRPSGAQK